jgi:hypothetical protein
MRTREQVTPEFLNAFVLTMKKHVDEYKNYLSGLWMHKDTEVIAKLDKLTQPLKPGSNTLNTYYGLLDLLHRCLKLETQHHDHKIWKSLNVLLVKHLKTQQEAEWLPPNEDRDEHSSIAAALQALSGHALYKSKEEEDYCTKWNISSYQADDANRLKSWNTMRDEQWWQIEDNNYHELAVAAKNILGLSPDNKSDCFVLQDKDQTTRQLERELQELREKLRKESLQLDSALKKLRAKPKNTENTIAIKEKEQEKADFLNYQNELIKDKITEIQQHQVARLLAKDESHHNSLARLHDLYNQLSLWTPRNLTILFVENMVNAQVRLLSRENMSMTQRMATPALDDADITGSKPTSKSILEIEIDHLGTAMKEILMSVRKVQELINDELKLLQKIIDDKGVDTHGLSPFAITHAIIDPEQESKQFTDFLLEHFLDYKLEHFELIQESMRQHKIFSSTNYHGINLPRAKDIPNPVAALEELKKPPVPPTESMPDPNNDGAEEITGGLRRSKRVHKDLHKHGDESEASEVKGSKNSSEISYSTDNSRVASPAPGQDQEISFSDSTDQADQRQQPAAQQDDDAEESSSDDEERPLLNEHRATATPTVSRFSLRNVLIGLAIGVGIGLAIAGVTAAIIFSGGTAAAGIAVGATIANTLGTAGIIKLFAGIMAFGLACGGVITTALGRNTAQPAQTPAAAPAPAEFLRDSTQTAMATLRASRTAGHSFSVPALPVSSSGIEMKERPVRKNSLSLLANTTRSPQLSAQPIVDSQLVRAASAPNVYRR